MYETWHLKAKKEGLKKLTLITKQGCGKEVDMIGGGFHLM